VLGFLSVSTLEPDLFALDLDCFNPVLGFLSVSTGVSQFGGEPISYVSIPCWVF